MANSIADIEAISNGKRLQDNEPTGSAIRTSALLVAHFATSFGNRQLDRFQCSENPSRASVSDWGCLIGIGRLTFQKQDAFESSESNALVTLVRRRILDTPSNWAS